MRLSIVSGALVALLTGLTIGAQSFLTSRSGSYIGDVRTGILTNAMGGVIAGALMLLWLVREGPQTWQVPPLVVGITALSGVLGVLIVTGISFAMQRAGIAAGLASMIFGQLALSTLIDTFGWGGAVRIPLTAARLIGLLVIGAGVYLLLPKT